MSEAPDLFAQQQANRRRSRWLVIGFVLFFAWLGFGGDWIYYLYTVSNPPGAYHHLFPWIGFLLTTLGSLLALSAWRSGPQKILWATAAREVTQPATPQETQLVNVVEEMAIAAALPRPRIWVVDDPDPNAFATGHDEQSANLAVTAGLLRICSRDELQAVVAHELGHVKNLDVRLMTLLAALVGAVALLHDGASRVMSSGIRLGGGSSSRGRRDDKDGPGAVVALLLVLWLVSWALAPVVTRLLALGVSRRREFLADAMSAQFTRNPHALATALQKIEGATEPTRSMKSGTAHLCIADPTGGSRLTSGEGWLADALGTHPPMAMRIARLEAMAFQDHSPAGAVVAS
ncbi:MAG: M48 family metalloprotease [Gemmatimonadota bacterium]|nr:M48 family metalloprotease [Gemmatimonadota bacterium]